MSFDQKVYFIQYVLPVFVSTFLIGFVYILWDVLSIRRGYWLFNDEFVGTFRLFHLPVGEWLFFLLIPYCCVFILEVVFAYYGIGGTRSDLSWIQYALGIIFIVLAFVWHGRRYTFLSMVSTAVFFLATAVLVPGIIFAPSYVLSFFLIFLLFFLVDGIYTTLPSIFYKPDEIWGIYIGNIPLEDFFYNLSYIGLIFTVYLVVK